MRLLSVIKSSLVPHGRQARKLRFGLYRGLRLEIDFASQTQLFLGLVERETHPLICEAVSKCVWAVDIGAGQGELSLFLLRHSHAQKIYAFEPQQSERDRIVRNLELNGMRPDGRLLIESRFVGCSSTPGFASLDSLELNRKTRGFLKIDVDGAEMDVLRSGQNLLQSAQMDILLETHSQALELECIDFLAARGFKCEVIKNAWWRAIVPEHRPIQHNRWLWATKS